MKMLKLAALLGAAAMIGPAQASPLDFTYTDLTGVDNAPVATLTFTIDSNQAPDAYDPVNVFWPYTEYYIPSVRTDLSTNEADSETLFISFFSADGGGGFQDNTFGYHAYGPAVFTGPVDHPVFQLGTYYFTDWTEQYIVGSLTISGAQVEQPSVPEPASWALMVAGFGLAGGAMRRRSRRGAFG